MDYMEGYYVLYGGMNYKIEEHLIINNEKLDEYILKKNYEIGLLWN